jgi:transposase InsO family protein
MPWKECSVMEERLRFVARLLDGEGMSEVCREFGISRKTGYKIFNRYKEHGLEALTDRSRRPVRYAKQLPLQIEQLIVRTKREKPHWGARKIRELLVRRLDQDFRVPAKSTIHAVLHRHGLVRLPGRPRRRATGTSLSAGQAPNALWCADFKGEFKLGNGQYCYPLTVTDHASRYLLMCEALASVREETAFTAFEQLFRELECPLQPLQAVRLVAAARHRHRTHQTRPAAAERPPRAHASDPQAGNHPTAGPEQPAAADPLRRLPAGIQQRASA